MARPKTALLAPQIVVPALGSAFGKLDPRAMIRNPVMFVVEVVALLTTVLFLRDLATGAGHLGFSFQIILWLWFTLLLRQLRRGDGRGSRQGAGRRPRAPPAPPRRQSGCSRPTTASSTRGLPAETSRRATWSWSRRATSSPATAR